MSARAVQLHEILHALRPGASWATEGEEYDDIVWLDDASAMPSRSQVDAMRRQLQEEAGLSAYRSARAAAYPPLTQQLDMLYWDRVSGTSRWEDAVAEVKRRFPKPVDLSASHAELGHEGDGRP